MTRVRRGWQLQLYRNGRQLFSRRFADEQTARMEADSRRRELQRAGWTLHW